jgi:serine protease Do
MPPPIAVSPLSAGQAVQSVKFARAAFQIPEGATWAYEGPVLTCSLMSSQLKWRASDWRLDAARLGSVFREEYVSAGFAQTQNTNLFADGPTADRYQVAALITAMDARFCALGEVDIQYNGRMRMSVEWQLYDNVRREVVQRFQTMAGGESKLSVDGVERTFYAAFRGNVRALLASSDFRQVVTTPSSTSVLGEQTPSAPLRFSPAAPAKRTIASSGSAVAAIFAGDSHGSAFLISRDGYLLTNHHVVGDAKYVKVRWSDGVESVGEVIRLDRRRDVAIVKADPGARQPLAVRSQTPGAGEPVFAIGTPLDAKLQGTVTKGIVSATRTYEGLPYIQSDVVINGGNSGGPLLDEAGAVIGICVSGMEINGAPVGINLFIPIDDALKALALTPTS